MTFACGAEPLSVENEPEAETTASFLTVARPEVDATEAARMRKMMAPAAAGLVDPNESFYLAIHRRELERRWFLSAYLKQFSPGGPLSLAARSLGIRVVSFRVQNGKLFVFDVDDRKQTTDNFFDQPVVEAYPIVDPTTLSAADARRFREYIVVDPAAGLNRYGVVGDTLGRYEIPFKVELAFSQNFRALADGASFEQAFTGHIDRPLPFDGVDPNPFRITGILNLALRRYEEPEGFAPMPAPGRKHYFETLPRRIPNTGDTETLAIKWHIHPGMKPIVWKISPLVLKAQARPEVAALEIDLLGAIKAGIESWNAAFGFEALRAEVAESATAFGDDDSNHLIWDVNPTVGFAFADFRPNPNNGQIRGASVYMNEGFLTGALAQFGASPASVEPAGPAASVRLVWQAMNAAPLCDLHLDPFEKASRAAGLPAGTPASPKQRIEKSITFLIAHEIGHTLGLRHNFKGSLLPP
ncbi:MAG TPA: zinc-dependent metalloprotease, partial [Polyangia bacterium]